MAATTGSLKAKAMKLPTVTSITRSTTTSKRTSTTTSTTTPKRKLIERSAIALPLIIVFSLGLGGCVAENGGASSSSSQSSVPAISPAHKPENLNLCTAPVGIELNEIGDVVDWINAMPKPLTLACFVASLPRPLHYLAVNSGISAQPSVGEHNPRVFVQFDRLWLSYVTQEALHKEENKDAGILTQTWDADGIQLLEMGYEVDTDLPMVQSLKAELGFPILDTIPASAPYSKINYNEVGSNSICGGCHANERVVDHVEGVPVFRSAMLRNHDVAAVGHSTLVNEYLSCNPDINTGGGDENNEWYRCQMLEATYNFGEMRWVKFRDEISTF